MSICPKEQEFFYVGVDGGGTKCRAVLTDAGNTILGTGIGGPSNPYQDIERAMASVTGAIQACVRSAGLDNDANSRLVVGMGLAGVNIPSVHSAVCGWNLPYAANFVTTDVHVATIAAHESLDGAVIVIGTGSCGYSYNKGKSVSVGGHGFPLGDKGSGAWLGLSAVQAALLDTDDIGPTTVLTELLSEQLNATGLDLVERLANARQSDFGALAPLVFSAIAQNDQVALRIVQEGADYLSAMTQRLLCIDPPRLSAIGSLAPKMLPYMDPEITKRIEPALKTPEMGAVLFAQANFKN